MDQQITVNIDTPISSVGVVESDSGVATAQEPVKEANPEALKQEKENIARLCSALEEAAGKLTDFQQQLFNSHREPIAKLAVEIARKILLKEVQEGNYEIEKIILEALKISPTQQDVVVRLNPGDLEQYEKSTKDQSGGLLTHVKLAADPGIEAAQCVVDTDKGMVEYLIEEHLANVSEALIATEQ